MARTFLEQTASQLTYAGLVALNESLEEDELVVLFRNDHFTTMLKHRVRGFSPRPLFDADAAARRASCLRC